MRSAKNIAQSLLILLTTFAGAPAIVAQITANSGVWVGSWAAAQQIPEPQNSLAPDDLRAATVRQIVRLSIGGTKLRVHLSNVFGTEPLLFSAVHIAQPLSANASAIDPESDRTLTFAGRSAVVIPAGAEYISDPIDYPASSLSNLAITFYIEAPPSRETGHPGSRATSYYLHGNFVSSATLPGAKSVDHWFQISGVDVLATPDAAAIVALGDSITDGHASTTNGNDRWTDILATRLQASPSTNSFGVLNQGIGGNHLLADGLGPNALARFDRDVLSQTGVRWLIVLEGVNDLGGLTRNGEVSSAEHSALVGRVVGAYQQMILRAHAHGIRVIGATITPYSGSDYYHPGPASEADREAINAWIRDPGHFDAVIDFDKVVRDAAQPNHLLPAYDCGDHLHPNPAGYRAMGDAVNLSLFVR